MEQEKINRLQWILDDAVARGEIPGAILMVRKEGKETVYLESGYADIEAKKPVSRDSIYRLYSMSKPITATAVMILVERGLIDLADPVCRYLPGFCGQMVAAADGHVEKPWRDVTIQDLVNMTSGLVYDGNHLTGKQTEALFAEVIQGLDEGEGGAYGTVEIATVSARFRLPFSRRAPGAMELPLMWQVPLWKWFPVCGSEIFWKKRSSLHWKWWIQASGYRKRSRAGW